jgi:hypothetical protein
MTEDEARRLLDQQGGITNHAGFMRLIEARLIVLDGYEPESEALAEKVAEVDATLRRPG